MKIGVEKDQREIAFGTVNGTAGIPSGETVSFDIPRISGMNRIFLQTVYYGPPSVFMATVLSAGSANFVCRVENKSTVTISKGDWKVFWMQTP